MASDLLEAKCNENFKDHYQEMRFVRKITQTEKLAKTGLQQSGKYPSNGNWKLILLIYPKSNDFLTFRFVIDTLYGWAEAFPLL